ncbi:carboxylesterase family protein [Zemynaea arenosa]|nr:carboxylesterase family protein [Massilia arenosa]
MLASMVRRATSICSISRRRWRHGCMRGLGRLSSAAWLCAALLALVPVRADAIGQPPGGAADAGAVRRLIGIEYAQAGRWEAPRDVAPFARPELGRLPPRCPQSVTGLASGSEREDCLYLNVVLPLAPLNGAKPLPVYVYVHGGGATAGSANDHDGTRLALATGAAVVSINYRLGHLGFLAGLPGARGNYALLDVLSALRWVHAAAPRLGLDATNITLGGESAGGTVVCALLAMPQAAGLFQRAIISSDDCLHDVDDADQASRRAADLLARTNCPDLACLRALPPAAIVKAGGGAAPTVQEDGPLPRLPIDQIHTGRWLRTPLLIGANAEEGRIIGPSVTTWTEQQMRAWLTTVAGPDRAQRIAQRYADVGAGRRYPVAERMSAILTDSGMRGLGGCTILDAARSAALTAPVHFYEYQGTGSAPDSERFATGAAHAAELPLLWDPPGPPDAGLLAQWRRFIRGEPLAWPPLGEQETMYVFGTEPHPIPVTDYTQRHRCAFWHASPPLMPRGDL